MLTQETIHVFADTTGSVLLTVVEDEFCSDGRAMSGFNSFSASTAMVWDVKTKEKKKEGQQTISTMHPDSCWGNKLQTGPLCSHTWCRTPDQLRLSKLPSPWLLRPSTAPVCGRGYPSRALIEGLLGVGRGVSTTIGVRGTRIVSRSRKDDRGVGSASMTRDSR